MASDVPDAPTEFDLGEAPAEGDGYYQAKTRQWVDLCPHFGPSDRTVLRILTDLTTQASRRRKVSLDQLRGFVTTNPVALGEEPKPISASGLLRILRNLAALGQITADEDGTPITFSSRKNAQARPVTMTIWRLPRHECGCHRNAFDALASVTKDQEPRYEPARMDESAVRRRPKRAGQKSDPGRGAGQKSNPGGQKSNPGGQKSDPHSQGDQPKPAPPITPPTTLSSSSSGSGATDTPPTPQGPADDEEKTPSAETTTPTSATVQDVMRRTDASTEEANAILDEIEADAERRQVDVGSLRRYVARFDDRDLLRVLRQVRTQRAPQDRPKLSVPSGGGCSLHAQPVLPCRLCAQELRAEGEHARRALTELLQEAGPKARPDLVDLLKLEAV
ncbi:hypothetical protein ACFW53_24350 [Nocardiopsis dassonvillei]|uniref:hypothetical protein n=1 Tax=Nocardiopsis dassonvillei TaxID=2014 RepID=UPI00366E48F9